MKKLTALLLALFCVFSLFSMTACDEEGAKDLKALNGKTPEELYNFTLEKLANIQSYEMQTSQDIAIKGEASSMAMTTSIIAKVAGDNAYSKISANIFGFQTDTETWYVDGVVYTSVLDEKTKATVSKQEFLDEYFNTDTEESSLLDIPKSWFKDITFKPDGDSYYLNFVVSGSEFNELFDDADLEEADINGDVSYKVYFDKEGNLSKIITTFDMTVDMGLGTPVNASCVSTSHIRLDDTIVITAPEDAADYTDMSDVTDDWNGDFSFDFE